MVSERRGIKKKNDIAKWEGKIGKSSPSQNVLLR